MRWWALPRPGPLHDGDLQASVAGKPRLGGARAALAALDVADADRQTVAYAERKQTRLEELIHRGQLTAFPDALRFVQAILALGWSMAVVSSSKNANAMRPVIHLAEGLSLVDAFSANVCGRDLRRGKPDPKTFQLAAAELQVTSEHRFVAEDAPADNQDARAGGMLGAEGPSLRKRTVAVLHAMSWVGLATVGRSVAKNGPQAEFDVAHA